MGVFKQQKDHVRSVAVELAYLRELYLCFQALNCQRFAVVLHLRPQADLKASLRLVQSHRVQRRAGIESSFYRAKRGQMFVVQKKAQMTQ